MEVVIMALFTLRCSDVMTIYAQSSILIFVRNHDDATPMKNVVHRIHMSRGTSTMSQAGPDAILRPAGG